MTDLHKASTGHNFKDLTGMKFGMLTVLREAGRNRWNLVKWLVRCDCGTEKPVLGSCMRNGTTISCGCYHRNTASKTKLQHGFGNTRTANIWRSMLARCTNPRDAGYTNYGGRGIAVCSDWKDFLAFLRDMGECPEGYSIERIDVNGPYSKENCTWLPMRLQARNTRRALKFQGKPLAQIAEETGIKYATLYSRFKKTGTPFLGEEHA